jgi:hypothetical protein
MGQTVVFVNPLLADNVQEVAEAVTHELFHTLTLDEVTLTPKIADTRLNYDKQTKSYWSTPTTDKNIRSNAMNYNYVKIDGISFKEMYNSNVGLNKLTQGQFQYIIKNIIKQMQGYGIRSAKRENETNEEYAKRSEKYYNDYWGFGD